MMQVVMGSGALVHVDDKDDQVKFLHSMQIMPVLTLSGRFFLVYIILLFTMYKYGSYI
jgi:hypothetical protein